MTNYGSKSIPEFYRVHVRMEDGGMTLYILLLISRTDIWLQLLLIRPI